MEPDDDQLAHLDNTTASQPKPTSGPILPALTRPDHMDAKTATRQHVMDDPQLSCKQELTVRVPRQLPTASAAITSRLEVGEVRMSMRTSTTS